jgi:hypothetical protein
MSNQKRLEEYLVGNEKSYLKSDISNGKVIMLSGKWGSGKTHFWKNKVQTVLNGNEKEKKIPNSYISLYGKTSIEEIRNEVFLKIFESMDIFKIDDKSFGLAKDTANLVADLTKTVSVFGFNLDLSKIVDKSFEKLEKVKEEKKEKDIENILNSGAIICFDDFERKSKDIDLNDLFGFITQLTLNFDCKVVIILNDDVFEGEEKKIFSNVKEKSVSKFLKYEPSIKELFETIFSIERYRVLDEHREIILNTIEETDELNARIYIQILDNLVEWIGKNQETDENILRCLILVNINFILFHTILCREKPKNKKMNFYIHGIDKLKDWEFDYFLINFFGMAMVDLDYVVDNMENAHVKHPENFEKYVIRLKDKKTNKKDISEEKVKEIKKFIEDNLILFKSDYFANKLDISKNISDETFQKINNFIETGILINE